MAHTPAIHLYPAVRIVASETNRKKPDTRASRVFPRPHSWGRG